MKALILLAVLLSGKGPVLKGPIDVEYLRTHDADTIYVNVPEWHPFHGTDVGLRLRGKAAPELGDPNKEDQELSFAGRDYVDRRIKTALANGKKLQAANLTADKYGRRYDCDWILDGVDLGKELTTKKYVRDWNGRGVQPFKEND